MAPGFNSAGSPQVRSNLVQWYPREIPLGATVDTDAPAAETVATGPPAGELESHDRSQKWKRI